MVAAGLLLSGCGVRDTPPPVLPIADAPLQPIETIPIRLSTSWPALLALAEAAIPICRTLTEDGATCADPNGGMILEQDDWFPLGRNWLGRPLGAKGSAWREAPLVARAVRRPADDHRSSAFYRVRVGTMDGRREARELRLRRAAARDQGQPRGQAPACAGVVSRPEPDCCGRSGERLHGVDAEA